MISLKPLFERQIFMTKWARAGFTALLLLSSIVLLHAQTGRIVVSTDHHFLQHEDGRPFYWQGDTAWLLLSKLDRAETERYLEDRRSKGFNVIQVMVLLNVEMKSAYG